MKDYQVLVGNSLSVLQSMPANSVDVTIADPPYGYGIDVWDTPVDVVAYSCEIARVTRLFYAVFGQLPSLLDWHAAAVHVGCYFLEHIVWVKRTSNPGIRLSRGHESILIFSTTGKSQPFFTTRGPYEDVRVPGILVDVASLEGIQRHISNLRSILRNGKESRKIDNTRTHECYHRFHSKHAVWSRSPEYVNFTNVWSFLPQNQRYRGQSNYIHATEKPLAVCERLLDLCSQPGHLVLDPFAGSGAVGVMARRMERRYLGIDCNPHYVVQTVRRIQQEVQ